LEITLLAAACFTIATYAADIAVGTWKLNTEKSKLHTVYETYVMKIEHLKGDTYRATYDTTVRGAQPRHYSIETTFDGKEHPVPNVPDTTEVSEHPDAFTWRMIRKKSGNVVMDLQAVTSSDGKTHTTRRKQVGDTGQTIEDIRL